ncbi:L-threonylcarbamoyladenylate synthase [Lyngbya confervoides]|uniref:L-threonylcarbamoyladenylate synthase n=1 Tax=Lyngbya confervoides BDU141951 TaxID=1574623 RepID=A0ABD4T9M2_9CYAN|nr:L-threonylcarbamoyladenylate synthase [Lyngbya confervoides]MCM1985291.1 L-threonylcarbamoyladenylate synthase [Lyngbya confervoides BDU141951]
MARLFTLHPENPQQRTVDQICQDLAAGAVMLYPTDTVYAIGCDLNSKSAIQRVRQLKQLSNDKPVTFLCSSLSNISQYAYVKDPAYRLMRRLIPGPYTFILPATKLVPKIILNPKRKTTGIRVPDHVLCQSLLTTLDHPIVSTSARLPEGMHHSFSATRSPDNTVELFDAFDPLVDILVDIDQEPTDAPSTMVDLCGDNPILLRKGLGWEKIEGLGISE